MRKSIRPKTRQSVVWKFKREKIIRKSIRPKTRQSVVWKFKREKILDGTRKEEVSDSSA